MKEFLHWLGFHDWTAWGPGDNLSQANLSSLDKNGHPYQTRYCQNSKCHMVEVRAILV